MVEQRHNEREGEKEERRNEGRKETRKEETRDALSLDIFHFAIYKYKTESHYSRRTWC